MNESLKIRLIKEVEPPVTRQHMIGAIHHLRAEVELALYNIEESRIATARKVLRHAVKNAQKLEQLFKNYR